MKSQGHGTGNRLDEHHSIYKAIEEFNQSRRNQAELSVIQQKQVSDALQVCHAINPKRSTNIHPKL
jgi:hypothetical protein